MASNRNLYVSAVVGMLTGALFGYSIGLIGGILVLPSFLAHFGLSQLSKGDLAAAQARIVTLWLVGAAVGVPIGTPLCSKFGRKAGLFSSAMLYILGAGLQASGANLSLFELGRLINGLGVGMGTLVGPLYISEISPPDKRGMLMSGYQAMLQGCALVAFWGSFATHRVYDDLDDLQWTLPVALQFIPGGSLVLGTLLIPETPALLVRQRKLAQAGRALAWLRGQRAEDTEAELAQLVEVVREERMMQKRKRTSFVREALSPSIRKRLGVGMGLMIAQNMVGMNAINYYAPVIFMSAGFTSVSSSLFLSGLFGLVKIVSALAFMFYFVNKKGNLFWLKLGSSACGISMVILAYNVRKMNLPHTQATDLAVTAFDVTGIISVLMVYIFTVAFCLSLGPLSWNICAEIFPLHLNAKCCAITTCVQWLFQIVIASITPLLLASFGWVTYAVYAGFALVTLIWVVIFVPETKGVGLGKPMDRLFGLHEDAIDDEEDMDERSALLAQARDVHRRRSSAAANLM